MNVRADLAIDDVSTKYEKSWNVRVAVITILVMAVSLATIIWVAIDTADRSPYRIFPTTGATPYPVGVPDNAEPSRMAPPAANAVRGYTRSYVNDFNGTKLPPGWEVFTGVPGGDPGGQFASDHVVVNGGLLRLNTWKDPQYANKWVTGGLCQCQLAKTYGAYFIRSRETGAGANEVELLWPASNVWPPEIDFNESSNSLNATGSTVHYSTSNFIDQRSLSINMTKWHTWGVVWTPKKITYVVDGHIWGSINVSYEIPSVPMTLDFEQRTMCQLDRQCPGHAVSLLIDWVAEYTPIAPH